MRRRNRRGAATVELALVLPVFLLFVFALVGLGHLYMVNNLLKIACRSGARYGSTEGITTAQVQTRVGQILSSTVPPAAVTLCVKNADVYDQGGTLPESADDFSNLPDVEVSDLDARELFLVRATVNYGDVALLSLPFLENITLTGQTITRHE